MHTLYHHPMSASSRFIRLLLAEYGQSVELLEEKPWVRRAEFLTMNPAGTLPVMIAGDSDIIVGGAVIGEFLDETCGAMMREKRLMPERTIERAEARRLIDWFLTKFDQEVTRHIAHERVFKLQIPSDQGGGAPSTATIRAARANLKNHMKYLSALAASRDWLAGSTVSAADMAAAGAISVLDYLGEIAWEEEPAAKDWFARIKSRPSYRPLLNDKIMGLPPASHYIDLDF